MEIKRGFTLIELLVVIAIIGVLSSIVLATLNDARAKARDTQRVTDAKQIQNALELYASDNNGNYPAGDYVGNCSGYGSASNYIPGLTPTYISKLPTDPQGGPTISSCCHIYASTGKEYKLIVSHSCSTVNYQSRPSLLDPARDGGSNPTAVETGGTAWAWAVYSSGGAGL